MISLLAPTRGRPAGLLRMARSAIANASDPQAIELVAYLDADDPTFEDYHIEDLLDGVGGRCIVGERVVLSEMWNHCAELAQGEILMHCSDDIVFRSGEWDCMVREAFADWPDHIGFVYGRDGYHDERLGTHGFLHRRWVDVVGYFVPPYFSSDWNDAWLHAVAGMIGRRRFLPDVLTEHMHYAFGKGPLDQTHQDRLERHTRDDVNALYRDLAPQREADADKLRAAMTDSVQPG